MKKIDGKRREYQMEIRKQHIQKTFREIRKGLDFDFTTPNDIAALMEMPVKQQSSYSLLEILVEREDLIVRLPFIQEEMAQEIHKCLPLDTHLKFWKAYSQQLLNGNQKFNVKVSQVLFKIVNKYSYKQLHESTVYQMHFLNTLQVVGQYCSVKFKEIVIDWVAGPEGLRVVGEYMKDEDLKFPSYRRFDRLFKVVEIGLKSQLKSQCEEAAQSLQKILLKGDWDDSFDIYHQYTGIMSVLCCKIERYCKDESTTLFNRAVIYLLETYDQAVLDYGRGGLANTAALLISCPIPQNRLQGLQMMRMMTQIDQKLMITFLLQHKELKKSKFWHQICCEQTLIRNPDRTVREYVQAIFHNILAVGEQKQIQILCLKFGGRYEDILQMLMEEIQHNQEDYEILQIIMQSLRSLVFYGREGEHCHSLLSAFEIRGLIPVLQMHAQRKDMVGDEAARVLDALFYQPDIN